MCEFCTKHGEGKKWYLQINNYLEERLTEEERKFPYNLYENLEKWAAESWALVDSAPKPGDLVGLMLDEMKKTHWGQVVPLEDVEEIFDMQEAGCCGTAAVITPVGSITYRDRKVVYSEDDKPGKYCTELYNKLTAIQLGDEPDKYGWVTAVPEP